MPSLLEAQERFATAVLSAENPDAPDLIEHGALSPATRLEIYRNNVLSNYRNALRDTFRSSSSWSGMSPSMPAPDATPAKPSPGPAICMTMASRSETSCATSNRHNP